MKYLVVECGLSYAVVLDEEGRFLKVANLHYQVGQTVTDVIEMRLPDASREAPSQIHYGNQPIPLQKPSDERAPGLSLVPEPAPGSSQPQPKKNGKKHRLRPWMYSLTAAAACLILLVFSLFQFHVGRTPYASVYLTINPEVRIDVNRKDIVVELEGINPDGQALIENYSYKNKPLYLTMDELADRAIQMGFLHDGGKVSLLLDAEDDQWVTEHSDSLSTQLNNYLSEKVTVTIEVQSAGAQRHEIIIPVDPAPSQTAPPETAPPETSPAQTTPAETAPPQTTPAETAPPQTTPAETAPPQTAPPQTAPPQTAPPQTAAPQTAPPQTTPEVLNDDDDGLTDYHTSDNDGYTDYYPAGPGSVIQDGDDVFDDDSFDDDSFGDNSDDDFDDDSFDDNGDRGFDDDSDDRGNDDDDDDGGNDSDDDDGDNDSDDDD
ncbi:MAG TPA: hypothetical protein IAB60_03180 [Candidatus Caccovicinus merdipullorum]|uniref:Anti-sigma factor RsgI-like middle domain-containing protein n=1 Tax=Candidatus Caccovicinus merdipullorum TaxID=2840724 RepID=A0A9D1KG34_9FIRM|nr:hypothetical protein [Candidatus Caccovicinus merdipullorum]